MTSVLCSNAANVFLDAGGNNSAGGVYLPLMPFCTTFQAPGVVVVVALVVAEVAAVGAAVLTLAASNSRDPEGTLSPTIIPEETDRPPEETT